MFTGIIEDTGKVVSVTEKDGGRKISVACGFASTLNAGESIGINGVCHTVVSSGDGSFDVQSVEETLRKTNIGDLVEGDVVNLERSLTLQKLLDGHLVQGHVDTTGTVVSVLDEGSGKLVTVEYPSEYERLIVERGSVAVDGISLTVAREDGHRFTVAVIPHTWTHTNIQTRSEGDRVNLEFDILGKYVARHLSGR